MAREASLAEISTFQRRDAGQHPGVARWFRRLFRQRCQPGVARHGRSSVETLEGGLQFFGAVPAHPEEELPAALDQAACVNQKDASDPLPARPCQVLVQAPPCGQRVQVVGQQSSQPPCGVCAETAARHGAAGEAVLKRIMNSLGVAATTVEPVQDRLRGHRLRPEPVLAAFARRRDVGDQHAVGVGRLAALGRQFVIVDAQRIRPPRLRSRLKRRTAM